MRDDVLMALRVVTEGKQHFVVLSEDGKERERFGPYEDYPTAVERGVAARDLLKKLLSGKLEH